MLVTSSQSSIQRPLGLSVEELFALDRQYRRVEQQQHLAQLQAQTRLTSSNLNRLASRSLDLVSSSIVNPSTVLPSLEIHGHNYSNQSSLLPPVSTYTRSHSIDQLRYIPPPPPPPSLPPPPPPPPVLKYAYPQRSRGTDVGQQNYESKYRSYYPPSTMSDFSSSSNEYSEHQRTSCKLRRQQPIKRESSRRIVVRPVVHRRREPSIGSSCESLDEARTFMSYPSVPFTPSTSLVEDVIDDLVKEPISSALSHDDSFSDCSDENLYELRVPIGKTYDTSDISVQLEGPKILIHCHTIEPTDKRGNYRKHEYKSELLIPDLVDDETIVAYLTENGELIVEGKYHLWAWKEIQNQRQIQQEESLASKSTLTLTKNDGRDLEEKKLNNRIETLDNHRTVIHMNEPRISSNSKSVSGMIDQLNTLMTKKFNDGQYTFTNDSPPKLIYHLRLPFETLMDVVRVQSDPDLNLLKIFIEQEERNSIVDEKQNEKLIIRSTSRLCRLPKTHQYDYAHIRVQFLKENFIRIEIPTLN